MEKQNTHELNSGSTEAGAIQQAKDGDAAAFEYLYRAHCKRVYGLCFRMIKNPAEAEDLTQQAFLQVFRKIGTFRGDSGFSTWLHRVTLNVVLMYLRRKKPTELLAEDLERHSDDERGSCAHVPSDNSMLSAIERLNLKRAISKLPPGYKKLFLLHDVCGYQHSEIACLLGCSTGCSKSQLHKARKRLRKLLLGDEGRATAGANRNLPESSTASHGDRSLHQTPSTTNSRIPMRVQHADAFCS